MAGTRTRLASYFLQPKALLICIAQAWMHLCWGVVFLAVTETPAPLLPAGVGLAAPLLPVTVGLDAPLLVAIVGLAAPLLLPPEGGRPPSPAPEETDNRLEKEKRRKRGGDVGHLKEGPGLV